MFASPVYERIEESDDDDAAADTSPDVCRRRRLQSRKLPPASQLRQRANSTSFTTKKRVTFNVSHAQFLYTLN